MANFKVCSELRVYFVILCGIISASGDDITLEERDLADVLEALLDAKDKAYNLGLKLCVPVNEARSIRDNFKDPEDRLTHTIEVFLRQIDPSPSWRIIVNALRSPLVNLQRLANDIESAKLVKSTEAIDVEHNGNDCTIYIAISSHTLSNTHTLSLSLSLPHSLTHSHIHTHTHTHNIHSYNSSRIEGTND